MRAGDLTTAMRASMSAPGVFNPVERADRHLVLDDLTVTRQEPLSLLQRLQPQCQVYAHPMMPKVDKRRYFSEDIADIVKTASSGIKLLDRTIQTTGHNLIAGFKELKPRLKVPVACG